MELFGVGATELILVLIMALLVLGPQRMASTARRLGKMVRGVREIGSEFSRSLLEEEEEKPGGGKPRG